LLPIFLTKEQEIGIGECQDAMQARIGPSEVIHAPTKLYFAGGPKTDRVLNEQGQGNYPAGFDKINPPIKPDACGITLPMPQSTIR
jgi:hypothetical protein